MLAGGYHGGPCGSFSLPQDHKKAFEFWNRAAELGDAKSYSFLAELYYCGEGVVERDVKRALHHFAQAAIRGHEMARHNLGAIEESENGNHRRAMKHYMIAARGGLDNSLKKVGEGYKAGHVTKDEYARTLRAHKQATEEMKSEQRTKANKEDSLFV